jgi:hypothetical protein
MLLRPMNFLADLPGPMRDLGPYAVVALIIPGGCLIAFALWAFRHRAWLTARIRRALSAVATLGTSLSFPGST